MIYHVTVGGRTLEVELDGEGASVDGTPVEAEIRRVAGTRIHSLLADGASHRVVAARETGGRTGEAAWTLHLRGRRLDATVLDERTRAIREMTGAAAGPEGPRPLRAPMPGLVVRIEVAEGDRVAPGDGLAIVEAMKMENELAAEAAGTVSRIHVEPGEAVEKNQVMIEFEEEEP